MNKIICSTCGREVAKRKDGSLPRHATPGQSALDTGPRQMCPSGGQPA